MNKYHIDNFKLYTHCNIIQIIVYKLWNNRNYDDQDYNEPYSFCIWYCYISIPFTNVVLKAMSTSAWLAKWIHWYQHLPCSDSLIFSFLASPLDYININFWYLWNALSLPSFPFDGFSNSTNKHTLVSYISAAAILSVDKLRGKHCSIR